MPPKTKASPKVAKQISNALRSNHLTSAPGPYLIQTKSNDPPMYNEDAIFQRKVRIPFEIAANGGINFLHQTVAEAIGITSETFKEMAVNRVDVWANDVNTLRVTFYTKEVERDYSDTGVPGARRAHLSIGISNRDFDFQAISNIDDYICSITLAQPNGGQTGGTGLADFYCQFRNVSPTKVIYGDDKWHRPIRYTPQQRITWLEDQVSSLRMTTTRNDDEPVHPNVLADDDPDLLKELPTDEWEV